MKNINEFYIEEKKKILINFYDMTLTIKKMKTNINDNKIFCTLNVVILG